MNVPIHAGFSVLKPHYDAAILDLWGVIHDGHQLYVGVAECLSTMRAQGMRILLLSNAPRRSDVVATQLGGLGLDPAAYDGIVTSGDVTREAIAEGIDAWHAALGKAFYRLGPERDRGLMEGLDGWSAAPSLALADFILATGLFDDTTETVADYGPLFAEALGLGLPMICANPDLVVIRRGERVLCAGSLAAAYEKIGGDVVYHGKPHPRVYEVCLARFGGVPRERIVAIGDSLRTDIAGARRAGIDAVFVTGGIHAEELGHEPGGTPSPGQLASLVDGAAHQPTAILPALVW